MLPARSCRPSARPAAVLVRTALAALVVALLVPAVVVAQAADIPAPVPVSVDVVTAPVAFLTAAPPDLATDPLAAVLSGQASALGTAAALIYALVALARGTLRVGGRHVRVPWVTARLERLPPVAIFALATLGPAAATMLAALAAGQPFGAAIMAAGGMLLAGGAATGINDAVRHGGKAIRARRERTAAPVDTFAPPAGTGVVVGAGPAGGGVTVDAPDGDTGPTS